MAVSISKLKLRKKIGFIPIIASTLALVITVLFNFQVVFDPPYLQLILQFIFVFGSSIAIAYISALAYLKTGSINVLLLGSAIFINGAALIVSSWAVGLSANKAVTIGNIGVLVSSVIILASSIITLTGVEYDHSNRKVILGSVYAASFFTIAVISLAAFYALLPDFLTPDGPTTLRLVVLTVSTILYIESSLMFGVRYWRFKSSVVYWYALALGIISISLVAAFFTVQLGDIINWVSRVAIYLSGVYFLIALLANQTKKEAVAGLSTSWADAFGLDTQQSKKLFANMLNGFMYGKIETNSKGEPVDWTYLDVNQAFEKFIGLTKEQIVGKKVTDFFPRESKELFIKKYGRVALTGESDRFEVFRESTGNWLNVVAYSPKRGYFVSICEDVTECKRAKETLSFHAKLLSETHEAIFSIDSSNIITYWNKGAEKILGWTKEEAVRRDSEELLQPKFEGSSQNLELAKLQAVGHWEGELQYLRKDGTYLVMDVNSTVLKDANGKGVGIVTAARDITERKKVQEELNQSEELFSKAFHSCPFPIVLSRITDGQIIDANNAFSNMFGFHPEEVIGRTSRELNLFLNYAEREEVVGILLKSSGTRSREIDMQTKAGKFLRVLFSVETVNINGQPHMLSSLVDVTERNQLQKRVEEYTKNLESLVERRTEQLKDAERLAAIGATAGMVGHDIRNPLQAIISDVYLAKNDIESIPETPVKKAIEESLKGIEANVEYINKIIQDLQDYARPPAPIMQETDLELVCSDVIVKNGAPKNITVFCQVEQQAKKIVSDPTLLKRILTNLVNNAVQAMPEGGNLAIRAYKEKDDIMITVQDTGVGIPDEFKPKLFTPLFTTKSKGQGFGLAVVKRMIDALGGTVSLESECGKGTRFIIRLPHKSPENQ